MKRILILSYNVYIIILILESHGKNVPQRFLLDLLEKAIEITKSAGEIRLDITFLAYSCALNSLIDLVFFYLH